MKKIILALTVVSLVSVLAGCDLQNNQSQSTAKEPIKIGYSGALTGPLASLGKNNMQGVELAVEEINAAGGINGRKVEVSYQDDKFEGQETLNNYNKFRLDNVDAILTTTYGGMLTTASNADREQTVIINNIDASDEIARAGDYSFAIGIYDEGIGYILAEFLANKLQEKETAVIYNQDDPFVKLVKDAFINKFSELGGKTKNESGYAANTGDFRAQLAKVKGLNLKSLVIIGFDEEGLLMKQAREMGIKVKFLGIDTFSSAEVKKSSKGAIDGSYFTFWDSSSDKVKSFKEKYKNKFGEEPDQILFAVTGYDSMMMLAQAMKQAQEPRGESLKNALYNISDYEGLAGKLQVSPDGVVRSIRENIYQIKGDEFIKVE